MTCSSVQSGHASVVNASFIRSPCEACDTPQGLEPPRLLAAHLRPMTQWMSRKPQSFDWPVSRQLRRTCFGRIRYLLPLLYQFYAPGVSLAQPATDMLQTYTLRRLPKNRSSAFRPLVYAHDETLVRILARKVSFCKSQSG